MNCPRSTLKAIFASLQVANLCKDKVAGSSECVSSNTSLPQDATFKYKRVRTVLDPNLNCFLVVAAEGSIRKASEKLNIAASAVSRRITGLEEDLGVPLFERHARGLRLTDAGGIFMDHARRVMRDEAWAMGEIEALRDLRRGAIRLSCVEGTISGLITPAITEFRRNSRDVKLSVVRAGSTAVMRAVAADEADLGLAFDPPAHRDVAVVAQTPAPLYAVAAPEFDLAEGMWDLSQIAHLPIAIPPDSIYGIRDVIDRAGVALDPALVCDSVYGLVGFAKQGQGISLLPMCCINDEIEAGSLVARPLRNAPLMDATISLVARRHRNLPPVTRRFCTILSRIMENAPS